MPGKTMIGGTAYDMKPGKVMVDATAYGTTSGKTMVDGVAYDVNLTTSVFLVLTGDLGNKGYVTIDGTVYNSAQTLELAAGTSVTVTVAEPTGYSNKSEIAVNGSTVKISSGAYGHMDYTFRLTDNTTIGIDKTNMAEDPYDACITYGPRRAYDKVGSSFKIVQDRDSSVMSGVGLWYVPENAYLAAQVSPGMRGGSIRLNGTTVASSSSSGRKISYYFYANEDIGAISRTGQSFGSYVLELQMPYTEE